MNTYKKISLTIVVFMFFSQLTAQWLAGYSYRSTISINSAYVEEDLADFSFYFSLSDTDFIFNGNCGKVKNEGAFDIAFTDQAGTIIPHEITEYNPSTGIYTGWVKVPMISSSSDTDIFMFYGRRNVSVDPSSTDTWSSDHVSVWHFNSVNEVDATSFTNNLDQSDFSGQNIALGICGNSLTFNGETNSANTTYSSDYDFGTESFSVSGWIKSKVKPGSSPSAIKTESYDVSAHAEQPMNTGGSVDIGSSDLEIGRNLLDFNDYAMVAIKFDGINIPPGASIVDAYIEFTVNGGDERSGAAKFFIQVEDNASPNNLGTSSPNRPSDRTYFNETVSWLPNDWLVADEPQRTPNISSLVDRVVNIAGGWNAGNDLVFLVTGTGERIANSAANDLRLVVTYESADNVDLETSIFDRDDDLEELNDGSGTIVNIGALDFNPTINSWVGFRFRNVEIPNGAVIANAYIRFKAAAEDDESTEVNIYSEASMNTGAFGFGDYELSNRSKNGSITWNPTSWSTDQLYETIDLSSLIEDYFSNENWSSGNALSFYFEPVYGDRKALSRNFGAPDAPVLVIEYYEALNNKQSIVSRHDESGGLKVWTNGIGKISFGIDDDATWDEETSVSSLSSVTDQQWHHFAAVKHEDDSISIYLDGEFQDTKVLNSSVSFVTVSDNGDDVAEELTDSSVDDFDYPYIGTDLAGDEQLVGLRFQNVSIPRNATIISAKLQIVSSAVNSGLCAVEIIGDTNESISYAGASSGGVSSRVAASGTAGSMIWNVPDFDATNKAYDSPDISNIIQDIVSSSTWPTSGGDLGLFIRGQDGTGSRRIRSYNHRPGLAPSLFIQYRLTDFGDVSGNDPILIIGDEDQDNDDLPDDSENYVGQLDELKILNTQLSRSEIYAHYSNLTAPDFFNISENDQVTWTGAAGDNDWTNPTNWNSGLGPWPYMDFILDENITLAQNCTAGNMNATAGRNIDLTTSYQMQIDCDCSIEEIRNGNVIVNDTVRLSLPVGSSASEIQIDKLQIADQAIVEIDNNLRLDESLVFDGGGHIVTNGNVVTTTQNLFPAVYDENLDPERTIVLNNGGQFIVENVGQDQTAVLNVSLDETLTTFSRVELTNNVSTVRDFDVSICDNVYMDGTCNGESGGDEIVNDALDFTWDVSSSTEESTTAVFYWNDAMEMADFDRGSAIISYHNGSVWQHVDRISTVSDYSNSIHSVNGVLTSFSPKGVGEEFTTLPVELVTYEAFINNETIEIEWATSSEVNNDYFLLEKSYDGLHFDQLSIVKAKGNSNELNNYDFIDKNPLTGRQYYRLSQVDFDGTTENLGIRAIDFSSEMKPKISLFPNPSSTYVIVENLNRGEVIFTVVNALGKPVYNDKVFYESNHGSYRIDVSQFPSGVYLLKVHMNGELNAKKIIIGD